MMCALVCSDDSEDPIHAFYYGIFEQSETSEPTKASFLIDMD